MSQPPPIQPSIQPSIQPAPSQPRRRVVTQRRDRPFRAGLVAAALGLVAVVIGGVLLSVHQAVKVLAPAAREEIPTPLRFDAEDRTYSILLLPAPIGVPFFPNPVAELECTATRSDGSSVEVSGSRQRTSIETDAGRSVGSFAASSGPTSVLCDFRGSPTSSGYFVAVAPQRKSLELVGIGLAVGGVLALGVGAVLIVVGVRGRAVLVHAPPVD